MAAHNLLVVLLAGGSRAELRHAVEQHGEDWPTVRVVTPTSVGKLEWLATDEDEARAEADARALEAEWILAEEADVEGQGGDVDPVQAVEDALRTFPADEIVLVGDSGENGALEASLREFGLPVRRAGAAPPRSRRDRRRQRVRQIAGGRSKATPFVFFVAVNGFLLLSAVLISLIVLLVLWLT